MRKKGKAKLQTRFFIAYLAVAGLILLVFSVFFYRYVSKILINQETESLTELTASFKSQCDDVIDEMDSASINLNYSSGIANLLGSQDLDLSKVSLSAFTDLCVTINGVENKVNQINLYDYQGNVLQVGVWTKYSTYDKDKETWIEQTKETQGSKFMSTPYQTNMLSRYVKGTDWCLSLYRGYENAYGRQVGAVETVRRCKSIFQSIISYQAKSSNTLQVYVYDQNGTQLYPYEESAASDFYTLVDEDREHQNVTDPASGKKEILVSNTSDYTGWTYVSVQNESTVLQPVNALVKILLFFILIMLLVTILISYYMSKTLMRPINQLKQEIHKTELSTLDKPSDVPWENPYVELEELNQSFHTMRHNLKNSMDDLIDSRAQELKSRSLALQSQINPHFYYNSLASVIVLAENGQDEEVIRMCRNLTRIMRYITDSSSMDVSVADEIDYVQKYLYCMKVRYQTSLNYMIDIDEAIMPERIPRLIIQPIVENAIKYGINTKPPWGIAIHGKVYENHWQIDVMDSGNGFSEEALKTIHERIDAADKNPGMPEMQINGLGTLNVYLRWKLYCGGDMIFTIGNTEGGHAIVTIGRYYHKEKNDEQ